jgi:hypothetical protein
MLTGTVTHPFNTTLVRLPNGVTVQFVEWIEAGAAVRRALAMLAAD